MDYESFKKKYATPENEYLVMRSDENIWSSGNEKFAVARAAIIAYQEVGSGNVQDCCATLVWPVAEEDIKSGDYFNRFRKGTVYHIKAKQSVDVANHFYVTEVLQEDVCCPKLEEILRAYREPVVLQDSVLGKWMLDKDSGTFEGRIEWLGFSLSAFLDVDIDDRPSWNKALESLKAMVLEQQSWDKKMKVFAACELLSLANEWRENEDEELPEISEEDFITRIRLDNLTVTSEGYFTAYFDDGDLFWGHTISVSGCLPDVNDAEVEG